MCGRYTLTNPEPAGFRARFGHRRVGRARATRSRATTSRQPTRCWPFRRTESGARDLGRLRWGLVPGRWAERRSGPPLINARAESLPEPAGLRRVVSRAALPDPRRRVLRVAQRTRDGKVPIWFSRPDGDLFAFAGIWAELPARGESPGSLHSCAIVTCAPNELIRPIHDRMPVVLQPELEERWLDPELRRGGAAGAARARARRTPSSRERSATSSTTCARTART